MSFKFWMEAIYVYFTDDLKKKKKVVSVNVTWFDVRGNKNTGVKLNLIESLWRWDVKLPTKSKYWATPLWMDTTLKLQADK